MGKLDAVQSRLDAASANLIIDMLGGQRGFMSVCEGRGQWSGWMFDAVTW